MGATKNHQSEAAIREMAARAFPNRPLSEFRELTEGLCNAAYRLTFQDGGSAILKIAPEGRSHTLRNERNMMRVEVRSLMLAAGYPAIMAPRLYGSDFTKSLCSGEYFLMETMPGENFITVRDRMDDAARNGIHRELGGLIRAMGNIPGERFGILGEEAFGTMHEFFRHLMVNLLTDTAEKRVDYGAPDEEILALLDVDKPCFGEVTVPTLCHWDLWDGNVFVRDGHISGIIDWERTMWAEPLMCDQFRRHNLRPALLEGYGQTEFTPAQRRRMAWYDLFLFGTMITECVFRQYENDRQERWVRPLFEDTWSELLKGSSIAE